MNRVFEVSELNARIRDRLVTDGRLCDLWARGELSDVVNHRSGHRYFTLRDKESQISCVLFRNHGRSLRFDLKNGLNVLVFGDLEFYRPRGQVQILARAVRLDSGIGSKHLELEMLKKKLAAEGLFDQDRKKRLPPYPRRIGVVTSPDGAALRDVLRVLGPYPAKIVLSPAQVQGDSASESIAAAIRDLRGKVEVTIVCRGGGSAEDLWPFNTEMVARAIARSDSPVVTAVGHETDVTLVDFVADERAPTPSAAAELVRPDLSLIKEDLIKIEGRMARALAASLERRQDRLVYLEKRLSGRMMKGLLREQRQRLDRASERLVSAMWQRWERLHADLVTKEGRLSSVSPMATLSRGYTMVRSKEGLIARAADARLGEEVEVVFQDGKLVCRVMAREIRG
ncbi:MAG: exodeoxyribonuclease VII large subunit [Methanotrichaceae archaeon]